MGMENTRSEYRVVAEKTNLLNNRAMYLYSIRDVGFVDDKPVWVGSWVGSHLSFPNIIMEYGFRDEETPTLEKYYNQYKDIANNLEIYKKAISQPVIYREDFE